MPEKGPRKNTKAKSPSSLNESLTSIGGATRSVRRTSEALRSMTSRRGSETLRVRIVGGSSCTGTVVRSADDQKSRRWRCDVTRRNEEATTRGHTVNVTHNTHRTHRPLIGLSNHCSSHCPTSTLAHEISVSLTTQSAGHVLLIVVCPTKGSCQCSLEVPEATKLACTSASAFCSFLVSEWLQDDIDIRRCCA